MNHNPNNPELWFNILSCVIAIKQN